MQKTERQQHHPVKELVDVLVVGAGPTGTTLAAVLAHGDVDVAVVDGAPGPERESTRATTVHALTLAQLDALHGAGREISDRSTRVPASTMWRGRSSVAHVRWDRLPGPHPWMADLPQEETEAVLRRRLADAGGAVAWGWTAAAIEDTETNVIVELRATDGSIRQVAARYVIGCDGARSAVRHAVGIPLSGTTHAERFLLADARLTTDLDPQQTHIFVSTHGVFGVMSMPDGRFRLNGTLVDDEALTPETLPTLMARRLGAAADRVRLQEVGWVNEYRTHARIADQYRAGRVFLAGDAAHLTSPVSGQGMNLGIQDAVNLGWKLVHVFRGEAGAELLETYQAERRPAAAAALRLSEDNKRRFTARRPVQRALLDGSLRVATRIPPMHRQITWGPAGYLQRYGSAAVDGAQWRRGPRPGQPLARWVTAETDWATLTPSVAGHHHLLIADAAACSTGLQQAARERGVRTVVSSAVPAKASALLVRPDGVIGWRGEDGNDLSRHLASVLSAGGSYVDGTAAGR